MEQHVEKAPQFHSHIFSYFHKKYISAAQSFLS